MDNVNYKLFGREAPNWEKKYFFKEVGRGGNPDTAFMLLLASQRGRSSGASKSLGAEVFAKLVKQYGLSHLTDDPRAMVRRLVDIVSAEAADAKGSKTELAAGFLHMKGNRAAAGSVGRLRAGLADRDSLLATSPLPDRARQKGGLGQVALDLGHTVEGNLKDTPAFFIAPSSATAMGEEPLRKLLWEFASCPTGYGSRPPAGWEHLPCLIGTSVGLTAEEPAPSPRRMLSRLRPESSSAKKMPSRIEPGVAADSRGRGSRGPFGGHPAGGIHSLVSRRALWVGLVAVAAFLVIKFGLSGPRRTEPPQAGEVRAAPAGYVADGRRADGPTGFAADGAESGGAEGSVSNGARAAGSVADQGRAASEEGVEREGVAPASDPGGLRPLWRAELGGTLTSSPVDLGEAVAFGSRSGHVYSLSKEDGAVRWRFEGPDGFGSSPAAASGKIFIGCYDGGVFCLKAKDGSKVWSYKTGGRIVSSPAVTDGGNVLLGSYDGYLYCLSADGELLWRFNSGARVWASPAHSSGRVFFGDLSGRIHCLDASTGAAVWAKTAPGAIYGSPATDEERVYFGSSDGTVMAFKKNDGTELWSVKGPKGVSSSVGVFSGAVVVGYEDGSVAKLASVGGTRLWTVELQGPVRSRPVACNGGIAITCFDGYVYLLDVATGSTLSRYETAGKVYCTPLISSEAAYFGDMKGNFTALDVSYPDYQ